MTQAEDWTTALYHPDPKILVGMIACGQRPSRVDGERWDRALAIRIGDMQWASDCWVHDHHDEWMALWRSELPGLDLSSQVGEEPLIFLLLKNMGRAECRYRTERMHLDLWINFIHSAATSGLDFSSPDTRGATPLEYLLMRATEHPYAEVAVSWIREREASFGTISAERVVDLFDRLLDPPQRNLIPGQKVPEAISTTLSHAIQCCQDPALGEVVLRWAQKKDLKWDISPLLAMSAAKGLENSLPRHANPTTDGGRRL